MPLSDSACRNAKPKEKNYKLTDGEGMYLLVKRNGTRCWQMGYRFGGKQKTLSFGVYPEISLSEARDKKTKARQLLKQGFDPMLRKKEEQLIAGLGHENTFKSIALEWHEKKQETWSPKTASKILSVFNRDIFPYIGNYPINDVTPLVLLSVLKKIEDRGALEAVKDTRSYVGFVFRYGIATGRAERDIAADLKGAFKTRKVEHHAHLKQTELPEFFRRLETYTVNPKPKRGIELAYLTFVRTVELRTARLNEFNLKEAIWEIPPERMKMKRTHLVPLSRQAKELIESLMEESEGKEYLFENTRSKRGHMTENAMLDVLGDLGYKGKSTVHGIRSTASTILNESQLFRADAIERQLAHVDGSVRASYNHALYLDERREMMQWWADHLDKLRGRT
ncbi:tyrosine-type recombinase/integrase [Puniceicoccaceae bacterium K14]|nr:tyrosine-type recombinase/integrase [Puniceicoccaceae bacterium K14]